MDSRKRRPGRKKEKRGWRGRYAGSGYWSSDEDRKRIVLTIQERKKVG